MDHNRKEERAPFSVMGRYRMGTGTASEVELLDLSLHGCRFFDRFGKLTPGTELSLRIGDIGPIVAYVRWRKQHYVGVSFSPPLHSAVMDHMVLNTEPQ